jgi:hypothetical protein
LAQQLRLEVTREDLLNAQKTRSLIVQFEDALENEILLSWFLRDGVVALSKARANFSIFDVSQLATFVRRLDYYSVFIPKETDTEAGYSYLYDVLTWLLRDLKELQLVKDSSETRESFTLSYSEKLSTLDFLEPADISGNFELGLGTYSISIEGQAIESQTAEFSRLVDIEPEVSGGPTNAKDFHACLKVA